jgi:cobalt-zinc-cadmium efflux system outer membrane protein
MNLKTCVWLFVAAISYAGSSTFAQEADDAATNVDAVTVGVKAVDAEGHRQEASPARDDLVTLGSAIEKARANSPQIKSALSAMMASKGVQRQAGTFPNPVIGAEAENIAGQGQYRGAKSAEITLGVSQLIEIGGKRAARESVAEKTYEIAEADYKRTELDLIRNVRVAYSDAVAAQEEVKLAAEQKELAGEVLEGVSKRVNAAAEPLIQKSKAEVALATSEFAFNKSLRDLESAKRLLASFWGQEAVGFLLDASAFFVVEPPSTLTMAAINLSASPDVARLDAELWRAKANLELEKAIAVPDPTVSIGMRNFRENNNQALVLGISLPIPVWNANRGNIEKARHEIGKSESDRQVAMLGLSNEMVRAKQELETAYEEAESLKGTILPAAEKAFSLSRQGYQAGRFPYLEVLDAQRTLFEAHGQYIAALQNYHTHRANLERLWAVHQVTEVKLSKDGDHE